MNNTLNNQRNVFSDNLKNYMRIRRKTQSDIVADLGITASTVSDWVNGKKYPRVDKMQMLADYLHISIDDLRTENSSALTDDAELFEYLEELKNRPEMRMLFKTSKEATKADVERAVAIIEALKREVNNA